MRIALLSDVHANLPALEAVLDDAAAASVSAIWNLGDFVGYGPFPDQVVRRLRGAGAVSIIGNYDRKVLAFEPNEKRFRKKKARPKYLAFRWAWENLSSDSRGYLRSLVETHRFTVAGLRVLLTHGSPAANDELLGSDTPGGRLVELACAADADVIACGHSHDPFVRAAGLATFVNPGSVGRHEGAGGKASYAICEFADGELYVEHRLLDYDVSRTVAAVREANLPDGIADVFRQGRKLDDVVPVREKGMPDGPYAAGDRARQVRAVLDLARKAHYEREHSHQVAGLALELFDALRDAHELGEPERFWLYCAGVLHDIGWIQGQKGHHKTAQEMILSAADLHFDDEVRALIACVARYHRKALPAGGHEPYGSLSPVARRRVDILGGILRLADGLDRGHGGVISDIRAVISSGRIEIHCRASGPSGAERVVTEKKKGFLELALGRRVFLDISHGG